MRSPVPPLLRSHSVLTQLSHNRLDFLPTEFRFRLLHDEDLVSVWLLRGNQFDETEMTGGNDMKLAARHIRQFLEKQETLAVQFAQIKLICVGEGNVRDCALCLSRVSRIAFKPGYLFHSNRISS